MNKKSIEFFMVLTNRSIYLAHYTVKSYQKVYEKLKDNYDIQLTIYLNSINYSKYQNDLSKFEKYPFVRIVKSKSTKEDYVFNGKYYVSKYNGLTYTLPMERMSEGQDVAYEKFESDYFVTVDDDLEVLKPDFIIDMISIMESTSDLGVISTNKTVTHAKYDHYSNGEIFAMERNDTWFCMYKKESKVNGFSMELLDKFIKKTGKEYYWNPLKSHDDWDAYYKIVNENEGVRYVWDGAALLQEQIRTIFKHKVLALSDIDSKYENHFVHYAAFGKNVSVDSPFKVSVYRFLYIKKTFGIHKLPNFINRVVKKVFIKIFISIFHNSEIERRVPTSKSNLD